MKLDTILQNFSVCLVSWLVLFFNKTLTFFGAFSIDSSPCAGLCDYPSDMFQEKGHFASFQVQTVRNWPLPLLALGIALGMQASML